MLNSSIHDRPAARWAMAVLLAALVTALFCATPYASAQQAADETTTAVESTAAEPPPADAASAEVSADDEVLYDASEDADSVNESYEGPGMGNVLGRFILAIMVILIVLAIVLMIYQKLSRRGINLTGSDRPLRIVDKLALAPKQWVCILNVCDRYLLLGVAEKEINILTEVTLPGDSDSDENFDRTLKMMGLSRNDMSASEKVNEPS